jgi:DNA-binding transcriptional MerR regulator
MADVHDTTYLSIGEVLGLLLEEFPDVTISKIRFLESQGLISPERTPSGYRKFYDADVELLRVILTEQRQNYLPLRVIKDRLETGEIDPTGDHLRPSDNGDGEHPDAVSESVDGPVDDPPTTDESPPGPQPRADADPDITATEPSPAQLLPGVLLDRQELCAMVAMTEAELDQLQSFGVVHPRTTGAEPVYDEDAVAIAKPAVEFLRSGIDARHLRNWRTSAEREASLFEQIITPRFRQRNPEARAEALQQLRRLDALGAALRTALTRQALRHHFDG